MTELEVSKPKRAKAKVTDKNLFLSLFGQARWLGQKGASLRTGKSLGHCLR